MLEIWQGQGLLIAYYCQDTMKPELVEDTDTNADIDIVSTQGDQYRVHEYEVRHTDTNSVDDSRNQQITNSEADKLNCSRVLSHICWVCWLWWMFVHACHQI